MFKQPRDTAVRGDDKGVSDMSGGRSTVSGLDSSHLNGLSDPTDLPSLRSALAAEVVDTVADAVAEQLARAGRTGDGDIVVLVDATPIQRAGADLKSLVEAQLADRFGGGYAVR